MRYAPVDGDFAECDLCGGTRHLTLSIQIGEKKYSICIMCAKRIARNYTRFVATAKNRSYQYWYREREKLRRAKLSSGLEKSDGRVKP